MGRGGGERVSLLFCFWFSLRRFEGVWFGIGPLSTLCKYLWKPRWSGRWWCCLRSPISRRVEWPGWRVGGLEGTQRDEAQAVDRREAAGALQNAASRRWALGAGRWLVLTSGDNGGGQREAVGKSQE